MAFRRSGSNPRKRNDDRLQGIAHVASAVSVSSSSLVDLAFDDALTFHLCISYGTNTKPALLDVQTMQFLAAESFPAVSERAEFLLEEIHRSTTYLGQKIEALTKRIVALTYYRRFRLLSAMV